MALSQKVQTFARDSQAAGAVEFALVAPFFLALVFVTLMVGVLYMAKSQLDSATQAGARSVMTGQATTSAALKTAICNAIGGLFDCNSLMISINTYATLGAMVTNTPTVTYKADGTVANAWSANFGAAGSIMVLQVLYQYPVIGGSLFNFDTQGNGTNLLVSTAVFIRGQ